MFVQQVDTGVPSCWAKSGLVRMVSKTLIKEFKDVLEEDLGVSLTHKEAGEILNNLTSYFDLLAKAHHRNLKAKHDNYEK